MRPNFPKALGNRKGRMAQAARLNLRMQKELKLLLTDPPPGASFPTLSDDSSASSLTSIDALFQGPEGTVYANGVFKIEIQIPERYPFQPPIVTFATPIYHPNIDNGGRICLDILNLPPKGMWQPSLNISTVLTSIGLLLSEPNPDDGLMHEASRDYKYNRQVFDRNARSMTEKYARAGESESARGSHGIQTHTGQSTAQTEMEGSDASICITQHFAYHERYSRSGRKLSLESLGSSSNGGDSGKEIYKVPAHDYSKNHIENGRLKEANDDSSKSSGDLGKLQATRNKLLLKVSVVSHSRNGESENTSLPNQCTSLLETQTTSTDSPESSLLVQLENIVSNRDEDHIERSCSISVSQEQQTLHCVKMGQSRDSDEKLHSMPQHAVSQLDSTRQQEGLSWSLSTSNNKRNPSKDATARKGNCSTSPGLQKIGLFGLTPSLGPSGCPQSHLEDEKENLAPVRCLEPQLTNQSAASAMISSVSENGMYCNETGKQAVVAALKQSETAVKLPQKPVDQLLGSKNNMILHSENPSSPHAKYLRMTNDVRSDKKQQINQVCDRESTDKFKQLAEGSQVPEAVIVLDSEDSEDENVPLRSKLSLTKRCLSRKRKFGF